MNEITAKKFKENWETEVKRCIDNHERLKVLRDGGEGFVVMSESDWRAIEETLFLNRVPGLVESIHEAEKEPISEGTPLEELDW